MYFWANKAAPADYRSIHEVGRWVQPVMSGGPMSAGLKVTPEQLQELSGTVARVSAEVRGSHESLRTQLSPLFGADWSGVAAAHFSSLFEQFEQHASGLSQAMDGIGTLLGQAGVSYAEVEQQIAASFR
jgi:WXG100 family type VII secretion target